MRQPQERMDPREIQQLEELCVQDDAPWCQAKCPLHVDVRGMLEALARGDFQAAAGIYGRRVLFPAILSRVCDQPCRAVCKRNEAGEALNIGLLERSCAEYAGFAPASVKDGPRRSERVAVVGGGLSGLSAAVELVKRRYEVTLLEASDSLGGRLRSVAPDALPVEVMDEEIGRATEGVIEVHYGTRLGPDVSLANLLEQYDAVYLGVGGLSTAALDVDPEVHQAIAAGIDPVTFATSLSGVFAGGDLRSGAETVPQNGGGHDAGYSPVTSISDGRRAAISIDRFLRGESLTSQRDGEGPHDTRLFTNLTGVQPRDAISPTGPGGGYNKEEAVAEAGRCLQCQCLECVKACVYLEHFKEYPGRCIRKVTKNITSLPGKSYRTETPFINACSLCGLCGAVCPTDLDMGFVNREARKIMWSKRIMPPAIHHFAIADMDASNTGPEAIARNQPGYNSSTYLFFPGCQLSASAPGHVERMYLHLTNRLRGGVGLMLGCCGAPAAWAGRDDLFQQVLERFVHRWEEMSQPRIILACPTCSLMFKESLPALPTLSLWEVLDEEGLPDDTPRGRGEVLAVHDACTARGAPEIQDGVRNIVRELGYQIEELPYSRSMTKCCGYGGLMYVTDRAVTDKVIESRIAESPSDYLAYCSNCRDFFAEKGKTSHHILDLIFEGCTVGAAPRSGPTLSQRRSNRRNLAAKLLVELWGEPMPEPEAHSTLKLRIPPDVANRMERDFILVEDVQRTIHHAESTGNRLEIPGEGRFVAHYRPSLVTYWVEYAPWGDEYEVFNAYSHRMQIVKDTGQ